jgi:sugar phosphate isomerase/epimerase
MKWNSAHTLWTALLTGTVVFCGCQVLAPQSAAPALPKLGLQAWTFSRSCSLTETLAKAQALGIHYLQAYPGQRLGPAPEPTFQHAMSEADRAAILAEAKARDVAIVSYGVVMPKDEAEWRQVFGFAQAMGLRDLAAEPPGDLMPLVARLAKETGIPVAVHNHPPPTHYSDPAMALAAVQPYGSELGLCADTGHWVRAGFDPVAALRRAAGRIVSVHFKDLNQRGVKDAQDVPWGTGVSDAAGQIAELRRQGFAGVVYIEYEHFTSSPTFESDIARSAEYFRRAIAASDDDLRADLVVPPGFTRKPDDLWVDGRGRDAQRWSASPPLLKPDLSNADFLPGSWVWEEDVLAGKGDGDLWTRETYGDFVLSFEFRATGSANCGVFVRTADPAHARQTGVEIPIVQGDSNKGAVEGPSDDTGAIRQIVVEPGKWHHFVVVARGDKFQVSINHEQVVQTDLVTGNIWVDAAPNDPRANNARRSGRIGIQHRGQPVAFRHLHIDSL